MISPFRLLATAWAFYRKQPVLNPVLVWLIILPSFAEQILGHFRRPTLSVHWTLPGLSPSTMLLLWLLSVLVYLVLAWGAICVLIIATRLIKSQAGRSRTSFSVVRKQAARTIVPFILTELLYTLLLFLWSLLLIIPGIVFMIRTIFFPIAAVCEKHYYRSAFRRSREVLRGRTILTFVDLLIVSLVILLPAHALVWIASTIVRTWGLGAMLLIADGITAIVMGIASLLLMLCAVELYARLLRGKGNVHN